MSSELEEAYEASGDEIAGHRRADGVIWREGEGITVLCTATGEQGREHTILVRLDDAGEEQWRRAHEEGAGRAIAALSGGELVVAGEQQRGTMEFAGWLARVGADGRLGDTRTPGDSGRAGFNAVAVLADGSVVAGGTDSRRAWVVRDDGETTLDGAEVTGIAALPDGGFAAAAIAEPSTTALGLTSVAAYGSDGSERWTKRLPDSGRGEPAGLAALDGGDLVLVGHRAPGDVAQIWVVRLGGNGEVAWERQVGPEDEEQRGRAVAVLPDGDVAVAGGSTAAIRVARLSADGEPVWEVQPGGEREEVARALAATSDGDLLVAGSLAGEDNKTRAIVRRLDGKGAVRWTWTL